MIYLPGEARTSLTGDRAALVQEAAEALVNSTLINIFEVKGRAKAYPLTFDMISGYSPDTLQRLKHVKSSYARAVMDLIIRKQPESKISDRCVLAQVIDDLNIASNLIHQYINGLATYEGLAPYEDNAYPARRIAQATALLQVTHRLYRSGVNVLEVTTSVDDCVFRIKDEKLSGIIISSSTPTVVADLMDERDLITGDEVEAFFAMTHDVPVSLQTGAL